MANREIEAILRISSKLGNMTALNTLQTRLAQVNRQATAYNRVQDAMERRGRMAAVALGNRIGLGAGVGITATTMAMSRSYTAYADVERRLNRIAINAGEGRDAVAGMLRTINQASQDYAMAQDDVATGLETLVAAGRSAKEAMDFLPAVAATAQAAGADIGDIATTADAVSASFGIAGDRMQRAFDILVTSGKLGKFELKDMAQYLPSLAPAFSALGYEGEKGLGKLAAMLQTVRIRTGDASEAATAVQNILQKMESEETVKKFSKFGINLRQELARARKEGRDLVDVFIQLSAKATGGDLSKIPQLFTDAQFQVGMRALLQGREDLEKFQAALTNVDGATLKDLGQVLEDNRSTIDRMASSWEKFKTSLGTAIAPAASATLDHLSDGMTKADAINSALEKQGYGWMGRRGWWAANGFDVAQQDSLAWQGGYRSQGDRDRITAYQLNASSRITGEASLPRRPTDSRGMPIDGPIPTFRDGLGRVVRSGRVKDDYAGAPLPSARPSADQIAREAFLDDMIAQDRARRDAAAAAAWDADAAATHGAFASGANRTIGAGPRLDLLPPVDNSGLKRFLLGDLADGKTFKEAMKIDLGTEDLERSGEAAGQSIRDAAQEINRAGSEGGSAFASMLEGVGRRIGEEAAASFKANVGTIRVGVAGGGQAFDGDVGRSNGGVRTGGGPR